MTITIPMRLPSAANLREHWRVRHKRVIDVVEAAMRVRYGAIVAPLATSLLICLCGAEPSREGEA